MVAGCVIIRFGFKCTKQSTEGFNPMKYQIEGVRADSIFVRLAMMFGTAIIAAYVFVPRWFHEAGPRKLVKFIFSIEGVKTIALYVAFGGLTAFVGYYHSPH